MIENLKKKVFHLFLGISLKRRLFITYLLLSSLILMLTSVFFYTASKKVLIKRAALSSQQQLSLITSNLGEKIDNISNYAITLSINSNIADVLKENPTVPENTLEHFLVNSELTNQASVLSDFTKTSMPGISWIRKTTGFTAVPQKQISLIPF